MGNHHLDLGGEWLLYRNYILTSIVTLELVSFVGTLGQRDWNRDLWGEVSSARAEYLSWDLKKIFASVRRNQVQWQYLLKCMQPKQPEGSSVEGGLAVGCPPSLLWPPPPLSNLTSKKVEEQYSEKGKPGMWRKHSSCGSQEKFLLLTFKVSKFPKILSYAAVTQLQLHVF